MNSSVSGERIQSKDTSVNSLCTHGAQSLTKPLSLPVFGYANSEEEGLGITSHAVMSAESSRQYVCRQWESLSVDNNSQVPLHVMKSPRLSPSILFVY